MSWLKNMQIAVINSDMHALDTLVDECPGFENPSDIYFAKALVDEAIKVAQGESKKLRKEIQLLEQSKSYLLSTMIPTHSNTSYLDKAT